MVQTPNSDTPYSMPGAGGLEEPGEDPGGISGSAVVSVHEIRNAADRTGGRLAHTADARGPEDLAAVLRYLRSEIYVQNNPPESDKTGGAEAR